MMRAIDKLINALGNRRKPDAPDVTSDNDVPGAGTLPAPADVWHYEFAHLALRIPFFFQPGFCLAALDDPDKAQALVRAALARIAERRGLAREAVDEIGDTIKIHKRPFAAGDCMAMNYIVEMPPPTRDAECYFVALVFRTDDARHYLTLERNASSPASTMLGTWTSGDHFNYGEGPPPDLSAFEAEVARRVRGYAMKKPRAG